MTGISAAAQEPTGRVRDVLRRFGNWLLEPVDALDPLPHIPERLRGWAFTLALLLSIATPVGIVLYELDRVGLDAHNFDWLLLSGYITTIAGLWLARGQERRFADVAGRLAARESLVVPVDTGYETLKDADVERMLEALRERGAVRSHRWGFAVAGIGAVAWALVYAGRDGPIDAALLALALALAIPAGYLVGRALGRIATYGWVRSPLLAEGRRVVAQPGHPDRAAGLKPLGEFHFSQALLLALPGAFLLGWTVLFHVSPFDDHYRDWEPWYQGFLAAVVVLQLVVFVLPMWKTHVAMQDQKRGWLKGADTIAAEIADVQARLREDLAPDARSALRDQLAALTDRYGELERMPTWPVDPSLRRRFTLQAVAFMLPLATDAVKAAVGL